jgi:hypothetical protein
MTTYEEFLETKRQLGGMHGFEPIWMPDFLFPFQKSLVEWAVRKGRAAIFADCGLGKAPMSLVWSENVVRHTDRPVLICTPLAVSQQLLAESDKFGVECVRSRDGTIPNGARTVVTNYERLHLFNPEDVCGMVCDESSILKNFNGVRRATITEFMRRLPYRLLCTATAAPNDYTELGTSSEAIGEMGHMDMLERFFRNNRNNNANGRAYGAQVQWSIKPHAETAFWRWVCTWARACRSPEDLGFKDERFKLPPLIESEHVVDVTRKREGFLFDLPAVGLDEEREERRRSIPERCEKVAKLVDHKRQALVWCSLNAEADRLVKLIPGSKQVQGSDSDDAKEEKLRAFAEGKLRVLVTKPKIGAWGLNLQRCAHVTFFPTHSYEQYYQGVRRCWRFGQTRPVKVDTVMTEGGRNTMANLRRKAADADRMFDALVKQMTRAQGVTQTEDGKQQTEAPQWLS